MKKYNMLFMKKKKQGENMLNNILTDIMTNPILLGIHFGPIRDEGYRAKERMLLGDRARRQKPMDGSYSSVIMPIVSVFFIVMSIALIKDLIKMVKDYRANPDISTEEKERLKSKVIITIAFSMFAIVLTTLTGLMFKGII